MPILPLSHAIPQGQGSSSARPTVDTFTKNAYRDNVVEYVFTGLRKNEGIRYRTFEERFGKEFWDIYGGVYEAFMEYVKIGCAEEDGEGLRLTLRGMSVSNRIMALFV